MPRDKTVQCPVCYDKFSNISGRRSHQKQKNHYPTFKKTTNNSVPTNDPPPEAGLSVLSIEEKKIEKKRRQREKYLTQLEAIRRM